MSALKSTFFHVLELAILLAIVWGIVQFFPGLLPNEAIKDAVLVILAGLIKFARVSETSPLDKVPDWVNNKK